MSKSSFHLWAMQPRLCLSLYGFFDGYQSLLGSGYCALYQKQVLLCVNSYNFQILNRYLYATHMSGHSLSFEHAAG